MQNSSVYINIRHIIIHKYLVWKGYNLTVYFTKLHGKELMLEKHRHSG